MLIFSIRVSSWTSESVRFLAPEVIKGDNLTIHLFRKLARLRAQLLEPGPGAGGGGGAGFDVSKSGDARIALVGFPSVGKVSAGEREPRKKRMIVSPVEMCTLRFLNDMDRVLQRSRGHQNQRLATPAPEGLFT